MRLWIAKFFWFFERFFAKFRPLNEAQRDELVGYYETSMRIFDSIGIDIKAKPIEQRRLYNSMLVYLDREQVICPSGARIAMLIGLLESFNSGWTLPPTSQAVSAEFALEIEGYLALEIMRNNFGIKDIRDELVDAISSSKFNF
jgi:hypothetical protein